MIKYIKMTASSNFGNMFSVLAASALLEFLLVMSVHLIFLNLIYDLSCTAIPWDNVDEEFIAKPRKWDTSSVGNFMIWIGPTSSIYQNVPGRMVCGIYVEPDIGSSYDSYSKASVYPEPRICTCHIAYHERYCSSDSDPIYTIRRRTRFCGFTGIWYCIFDPMYSSVYDAGNKFEKSVCSLLWQTSLEGAKNELERTMDDTFWNM